MLALAPQPAQPVVAKEFTVLADPGDVRASRMAKDFATVISADGTPGRAIVGTTSPNGLGKVLKSDVADFAIVSLDSLLSSAKGDPEWMKRAPYVTRLAPETMAVIAPREVKSISDLQGKAVSFGDLDSATSTSGRMLFSRLGVTANSNQRAAAGSARQAVGRQGRCGRHTRRGRTRLHSAISAATAGFTSYRLRGRPALEPVYAPAHVTAAERPESRQPHRSGRNDRRTDGPGRARRGRRVAARGWARPNCASFSLTITMASCADERDSHWRDVNLAADASWPTGALAPARGCTKLAGRQEVFRRRIAGDVPRLGRSRPPRRPAGQARLIRIDFMKA